MQVLNDGGGIYTLSNQPDTIIRGNHVHDNRGWPGGIYLDEGSGFIEVTGNSVHNVRTAINFNNRAQNRIATCKVHDNFFNMKPGQALLRKGDAEVSGKLQRIIAKAGLEPPYRHLCK